MSERDIFLAAIAISDPAQRAAYVEQACGDDPKLRGQIEELLAAHDKTSQFLEKPAAVTDSKDNPTLLTDSSDDEEESTSSEAAFRSYLEPSTRPGWLGRLGHYEIEEILGQGAFGIVAKAFDEKLHRVVAIKMMNPELAMTSPPRKRFLREARSAAAVTHENIVAIHAVEEEPVPYLVMEYVAGRTLLQRLNEQGPFDVADVLRIGGQIASGLAAAHAVHLIHRDIKPANILLTDGPSERVKISDFGLARTVDDATMTASGFIAGTPMYMAPEQARGETLDHRADLFSLGSVLYQMVSGRPPFRAASTIAVLKRVCEDRPRPIDDIVPGVPDWLCQIIARLMEKDPDDRYQTAQEVADLLARCQSELEHAGQVNGVVIHNAAATTRVLPAKRATRSASRGTAMLWLASSLLVLVAIIGSLMMRNLNPSTHRESPSVANEGKHSPVDKEPTTANAPIGWHGWPADAPAPAIAPFSADEAKAHQEAWAKYLDIPVEYENGIGMKFRLIPPGEFLMGSTPEEIEAALKVAGEDEASRERINSEAPQHKVVLTQPVYVGVTEVTQAQYEQVMGANPSHFSATGEGKQAVANLETGNHPVEMVSWNHAAEFCAKLSQQEELKPFYFRSAETVTPLDGTGYRLPTEAEWEYACRAGTTTRFWSGDEDNDLVPAGWFGGNSGGRTHAAGELKANPFGLWDVHGNVWEWVQDSWDPAFYGKSEENTSINPFSTFFAGSQRVIRGANWHVTPSHCRSSNRVAHLPTYRNSLIGFRVVLPIVAVKRASRQQPRPATNTSWYNWPADATAPAIAPFDAKQAKAHQEAWAKYLDVPVEYENSIGMKFRLIPPGEFLMGSTPEEIEAALKVAGEDEVWRERINSEAPQHKVVLTQPVYVGVTEVTQAQYEQVMGTNPSHFSATGGGKNLVAGLETGSHPVEMVSWNDAAEFCAKLSQQNQLKPFYFRSAETVTPLDGTGYRLPTEAEWEYACRAGTTTRFWSGDEDNDLVPAGWFRSNSGGRTHAAGELKANPFGLFDVHGNIWEWVQDSWDPALYGKFEENAAINPSRQFFDGSRRVFRGGDWQHKPTDCRSARRQIDLPTYCASLIGFRVVLPVDAVKQRLKGMQVTAKNSFQWPADAPAPAIAPFNAEQARQHQEAWAKYLGVPVEYENSIGMKFRTIPPGEFLMGSSDSEVLTLVDKAREEGRTSFYISRLNSESPTHEVSVTKPFAIGIHEVTIGQFREFVDATEYKTEAEKDGKGGFGLIDGASVQDPKFTWRSSPGFEQSDDHPVVNVTWNDAVAFCDWLSSKEDNASYRLPTEAEWEFTCRAGSQKRYCFGNDESLLADFAWYAAEEERHPEPVGRKRANAFGIFDLHGNVWEWCHDWHGPYVATEQIDPVGPSQGQKRAMRGGSSYVDATLVRSSLRNAFLPEYRGSSNGFRVVLPIDGDAVKRASQQ